MATKAVRLHHEEGGQAARDYLAATIESSDYWGPDSTNKPAKGWAAVIQTCLDTYVSLAATDTRPALDTPIKTTIDVAGLQVDMTVDVVLLDEGGYTAHLPLWDKPALTGEMAATLAAALVLALEQELGRERVTAIEVWHLRSGTTFTVPRAAALAREPGLAQALQRFVS